MLVSKKKENSDVQVMDPSFDPGRQDQFHLTTRLQQNYCRIRKVWLPEGEENRYKQKVFHYSNIHSKVDERAI